MPGMHGYMGYIAGLGEMQFPSFLVLGAMSAAIWAVALVGIGAMLSDHVDQIGQVTTGVGLVIAVVFLVVAGIWYSKHHAHR
jgi:membrane protein DedA with SNARE-associated domain